MTPRDPAPCVSDLAVSHRFDLLRAFALLVATLIGLYVCYLVALPFLSALIWALTVAILAVPLHRRLENRLRHPTLAAAVSLGLLALLVFGPLAFLGNELFGVLSTGVASLQGQLASGELERFVESHPLFARLTSVVEGQVDLSSIFGNVATWLANLGASIVRSSLSNVLTMLLTFYLVFYFLRDQREALQQSKTLSPFTEAETDYLFGRVSDTVHAIIFGTVVTAAVQGTLGGAMFWLLGVPNPVFWGLVMALLAVIPIPGRFRRFDSGRLASRSERRMGQGRGPHGVGQRGDRRDRQHLASGAGRRPAQAAHRSDVHLDHRWAHAVRRVGAHPRAARHYHDDRNLGDMADTCPCRRDGNGPARDLAVRHHLARCLPALGSLGTST